MGSSSSFEAMERDEFADFYLALANFAGKDYVGTRWYNDIAADYHATDTSSKGYLNKEEFAEKLEEYFELRGLDNTPENVDAYFKKVDQDGDNRVFFKDYLDFAREVVRTEFLPDVEAVALERGISTVPAEP